MSCDSVAASAQTRPGRTHGASVKPSLYVTPRPKFFSGVMRTLEENSGLALFLHRAPGSFVGRGSGEEGCSFC